MLSTLLTAWKRQLLIFSADIDMGYNFMVKLIESATVLQYNISFYNEAYRSSELEEVNFPLLVPDAVLCVKRKPANVSCDSNVCLVIL